MRAGAVGVPDDVVVADYALTGRYLTPAFFAGLDPEPSSGYRAASDTRYDLSAHPRRRARGRPCDVDHLRHRSARRAVQGDDGPVPEIADVAVVGAGPAGCAAALRVQQSAPRARVLLLDAAAFPRDKPCGDGIAAAVFPLLAALGAPGLEALGPPRTGLIVRSPGGAEVRARCEAQRVLPRTIFDAALLQAALEGGALLRRHRVRRVVVRPDHVELDDAVHARVVVGADGANSVVRRTLGAPPPPDTTTAIAVRGYTAGPVPDPDALVVAFARGTRPAYAWAFPLADGRANVGFGVFGLGTGTTRRDLLNGLSDTLPGHDPDPATVRGHRLPLATGPRFQPDGRVLLAGDAAALINPITGEGILYAVLSGALAGEAALLGAAAGAHHRRSLRRAFARHHRHTRVLARLVRHPRFVDAAVAAAGRDRAVLDAVVDVGLGLGTVPPGVLATVVRGCLWPG